MKHIPTLTLTALAAAASAQTAPAAAPAAKQELSYNRVIVQVVDGDQNGDGTSITGQAKLGHGLYVSANVTDRENSATSAGNTSSAVLGYAYSLPSVAGITSDLNVELGAESIGLGVRALVGFGLEIGVSYTEENQVNQTVGLSANYSLGQFVKGLALNVNYTDGESHKAGNQVRNDQVTSIGLSYNF